MSVSQFDFFRFFGVFCLLHCPRPLTREKGGRVYGHVPSHESILFRIAALGPWNEYMGLIGDGPDAFLIIEQL